LSLKERNAWIEQAKERILQNAETSDTYVRELMFLYDESANQIENEINALFGKYAKDNMLSDAEASKLLSGQEYSKWKKSIDHYVSESHTDSKTLLELNTLAAKAQISRKEQLLANIYQNMIDLSGECEVKVTDLLGDMLKTNYYRTCYQMQVINGIGFNTNFNVAKINDALLKQVLEYPWSGKNFSKTLWENTDTLAALAKREITIGFMNGSSVQKMAKEINDVMGKGRYAAERLVRTESSYFANQGELLAYQESGIKEYEFLGGGCVNCQRLNGLHFLISEAETGLNLPPIHPNCKCTTIAYFSKSLFGKKEDMNQSDKMLEYEEWKEKYVDSKRSGGIMKLSDDEQGALNRYISSESYTLNEKLRDNAPLTVVDQAWIKNLDAALDKMPEYQGTLYRSMSDFGIEDVDGFIKLHVPGNTKSFPAYTSTSMAVYDEDFPIQYVIESRHGKDITAHNNQEKEVLFKRNSNFHVTKVEGNTIYLEEAE